MDSSPIPSQVTDPWMRVPEFCSIASFDEIFQQWMK